jgi:hypothetical protein
MTISTKPIFVAPSSCHNGQNICGVRLVRQHKHFVARGLFQQKWKWWRQVVISTGYLFVAGSCCDNTYIPWQKDYFNIMVLMV